MSCCSLWDKGIDCCCGDVVDVAADWRDDDVDPVDVADAAAEEKADEIRAELRNEDPELFETPDWIAEQNSRSELYDYPGYDGGDDVYAGLGGW